MHWKSLVLNTLWKLGYGVYRLKKPGVYNPCAPYTHWVYSPWFEGWFQSIYAGARSYTRLTEDRCYILYMLSLRCVHLPGDFAECGVYKGGSAFIICQALTAAPRNGKTLHLFDTFSGMPELANDDPCGLKQGHFGDTSLELVREYLQDFRFVTFHPGLIPDTLGPLAEANFALVHIDVDLYQTALDCCSFFYPRLMQGGVMVFDDYGFSSFKDSIKRAVDEFFLDKVERPVCLPTGQCIVIKL